MFAKLFSRFLSVPSITFLYMKVFYAEEIKRYFMYDARSWLSLHGSSCIYIDAAPNMRLHILSVPTTV